MQKFNLFSSLNFHNYRLYFLGSLVGEFGVMMQMVAITWQVYEITHSAASLGLIGLSGFIPVLVFSLLGGVAADAMDRRKLLIIAQIVQALLAVILLVVSWQGFVTPWVIYLMNGLTGVARAFQGPARQAIIPHLVPKTHFVNAVSLNTLVRQSSNVVGPAIAGFLIAFYGVNSVYLVTAISFVFLIVMLWGLSIRVEPENKLPYSFKSIWEGIHFVKRSPILLSTMILDFVANFFSSATTLLPIFATDILGVGAQGLGILYAAPSIGAVVAGLLMASLKNLANQGKVIIAAVIIYGLATLGFGLSTSFYLSLFFLALVGVADMISMVLRNTIRQLITPDHIRGRMTAVNMVFIQGGPLIGETEAGFVAALTNASFSVASGGFITVILAFLVAWRYKTLRNFQSHSEQG